MLSECKLLKWLDIRHQRSLAPFIGTVYGSLTPETATTLRMAKEAHCYRLDKQSCVQRGVPSTETVVSLKYDMIFFPNVSGGLLP